MEMITGNNSDVKYRGGGGGGRHMTSMMEENGAALETYHNNARCTLKRRRRDASNEQQQQAQNHQHQTTGTTSVPTVKRSSRFRGVSRHRWTGRFEAHLWDKGAWNPTQRKKGKQVYLGAYDEEESAARAYDLAALKYWGTSTFTNFLVSDYANEVETMKTVTREEFLATLRRRSSGFSRGVSKYRGVARHHHNGRWEARIGRVFGNKYLYLGTYSTQEEAAHAYDIAAIEYRGINAVTNFDLSTYIRWLRPEANPPTAPQPISPNVGTVPLTAFSNHIPIGKPNQLPLFFHPSSYMMDNLHMPQHCDAFNMKAPISACAKSSNRTALDLLFKSSIFRELVEKNNEESEAITQNTFLV